MKKVTFNVKQNSAQEFFKTNMVSFKDDNHGSHDNSVYHLMADTLFLKKDSDFKVDSDIVFELSDRSRGSNKELLNVYKYSVSDYDDVSVKLTLEGFEIKLVNSK